MSVPDGTTPGEGGRTGQTDWTCYRHDGRRSGVRCTRCERPICPDCMISAPVGFQCPSCVKGGPQVRTLRSLASPPRLTQAIIAVNVAVAVLALVVNAADGAAPTLFGGGNALAADHALNGGAVADGEWLRLLTSGFLHYGLLHLGFNMFILLQLGTLLEPALGRLRLAALYIAALLGGSLGVILLQPGGLSAGASGAVFGLMGAAVLGMRARGADPMASGLPMLLGINLLLTFALPGISIGAHLGGLAVGAAAGALLFATDRKGKVQEALGTAGVAGMAVACTVAAVLLA